MAKKKIDKSQEDGGKEAGGRLAKDGTRRGIASIGIPRAKKKKTLSEDIAAEIKKQFGIDNWHPVKQAAIWAMMVGNGYEALDEKGNPVLDENGQPVKVPPNIPAATSMLNGVMRYTQRPLAPLPVDDSEDIDDDFERQQEAIRTIAQKVGKELPAPEQKDEEDDR